MTAIPNMNGVFEWKKWEKNGEQRTQRVAVEERKCR